MKRLTVNTRHDMLVASQVIGDGYRTKALAHNRPVKHIDPTLTYDNMMHSLATTVHEMPVMEGEDYRKLSRGAHGGIIGTIENGAKMAKSRKLTNMERLSALANAIDMLGKFNAGLLVGGNKLKSDLTDYAWTIYLEIEMTGLDNAHFSQTDLPCDDRNTTRKDKGSMFTDLTATGKARRVKQVLPDSSLSPELQYCALSVTRKMTINRD